MSGVNAPRLLDAMQRRTMMAKHVSQYSDIPNGPHFVIFTTRGVYVPGDERSRTNPGHGYPASTENVLGYEAFEDRSDWEARIAYLTERNQLFSAAHVSPASVKQSVAVDVDLSHTQ